MSSERNYKITFLGDISLNDNYISYYKEGINPFTTLEPYLKQSHSVVGNLECISEGDCGVNELKKPRLTTTVETLNYLENINLSVACLGQNHVYDHLEDGFLKTTKFLNDKNIKFFGASTDQANSKQPVILEEKGIKVGMLNYVTGDTNPNMPEGAGIFLNIFRIDKVLEEIQNLKPNVDHLVVILHWGGRVEGGLYPDWHQPKLARQLVDAGADLIIGHHSHTFQPFEIYKGKYIFYSLGNFCFSDYVFDGVFNPMPLRRRITSLINIDFTKTSYKIGMQFFRNDGRSFSPLATYIRKVKIRNAIQKYFMRFKPIWFLYFFYKMHLMQFIFFLKRADLSLLIKFNRLWKSLRKRLNKPALNTGE